MRHALFNLKISNKHVTALPPNRETSLLLTINKLLCELLLANMKHLKTHFSFTLCRVY